MRTRLFLICLLVISACNKPKWEVTNQTIQQLLDKSNQYIQIEKLDSAQYILSDLLLRLKTDSLSLSRVQALKNMGIIYDIRGKYDSAGYYFYEALHLAEDIKAEEILLRIFCDLGILHYNLGKSADAITYYEQMLHMAIARNDTTNMIRAYNNIGNTHATLNHDYEKAISCFENSIRMGEKTGYKSAVRMSKTTLAQIYSETGELDKAYKLALDIKKEYGYNAYTDFMLADILRKKGVYDEAIGLYTGIMEKGTGFDTQEFRLALLDNLYQSYEGKHDYEKALKYSVSGRRLRDTLHNIQSEKEVQNLKIAYETEKKEFKISSLEKEKELYRWLGFAGGAIVLLLVAFLVVRQRMVRQKMERLEREKQLAATQSVLNGETAERTRLARDLHDGLGGMLSVVKLNLSTIKQGVSLENEEVNRFDAALKMLDDSIGELRRVAHNMMPDSLSRYGLKTALTDFCNSVVGAEFHYFGSDDRLNPKLEVMIYRTVHELVNNVLKHAGATKIMIQVIQEPNRISITVQDDGCGFDTHTPTSGTGFNNIRNRVGAYNGQMDIFSRLGEGTEASVYFKLPE